MQTTMTVESLKVSRFIAGFWRQNAWDFSDAQLQAFVEGLLELGVTSMDHAFVYRSEAQFGRVLKLSPSLRDQMQIISKFGIRPGGFGPLGAQDTNHYDSSAAYLRQSVEHTLKDLNTDFLDVLLVHRPDYLMDARELAEGCAALLAQGKVKHIGVSNFTVSQFALFQSACDFPLVTNQIEFSPVHLEPLDNGVLDQCQQRAVNPMLWSVLGGGRILTADDERAVRLRAALQKVAEATGAQSLDQVIYAWALMHPSQPLPILGTSRLSRVKTAIAALELSLTREHWYAIWEASTGHSVP